MAKGIYAHKKGIYHHSEETRRKISASNKKTDKIEYKCPKCGKIFTDYASGKRKYCSNSCAMKSNRFRIYVNRHTEESKKKMSLSQRGRKLSEETKRKMSLTHKTRGTGLWMKGRRSPRYKGLTPIQKLIRKSVEYVQWRQQVFIRDDFTCQRCGTRGAYLEAHHINPFYKLLEEAKQYLPLYSLYDGAMLYSPLWDIDNGITLCQKCHNETKTSRKNDRNPT